MMDLCSFFFHFACLKKGRKRKKTQETVLREAWTRDTCPMTQFFVEMDKIIKRLDFYVEPIDFDFDKFVPRIHLFIFSIRLKFSICL